MTAAIHVRIFEATIVGFDSAKRLVTVRIADQYPMPSIGIGDPAEITPNPKSKVPCGWCGSSDGGFPGNHGPECPVNPRRVLGGDA